MVNCGSRGFASGVRFTGFAAKLGGADLPIPTCTGRSLSLARPGERGPRSIPLNGFKVEDQVCNEQANHPKHAPTGALHRGAAVLESGAEEVAYTDPHLNSGSRPPQTAPDLQNKTSHPYISVELVCFSLSHFVHEASFWQRCMTCIIEKSVLPAGGVKR